MGFIGFSLDWTKVCRLGHLIGHYGATEFYKGLHGL